MPVLREIITLGETFFPLVSLGHMDSKKKRATLENSYSAHVACSMARSIIRLTWFISPDLHIRLDSECANFEWKDLSVPVSVRARRWVSGAPVVYYYVTCRLRKRSNFSFFLFSSESAWNPPSWKSTHSKIRNQFALSNDVFAQLFKTVWRPNTVWNLWETLRSVGSTVID